MVAPPSLLFAGILFAFEILAFTQRKKTISRLSLPLLLFVLAALGSTLISFFIVIPPFKEANRISIALTGLLTLGCGFCFYIISTNFHKIEFALRWINLGGLITICWSAAQSIAWQVIHEVYPDWMWQIQEFVSSSGALYNRRATGLAYEPSWLGHQLVMLYLPLWLACSLTGFSAHRRIRLPFKLPAISFENFLLMAGAIVLYLSYARGSLASFFIMLAIAAIYLAQRWVGYLTRKIRQRHPKLNQRTIQIGLWSTIILITLILAISGARFYLSNDFRMEGTIPLLLQKADFNVLAHKLFFGERAIFWQAGLDIFIQHPIFGVGLGNAGFFFPQVLPPIGWTMAEPHKMYFSDALPNTLSLWIRLLSETGALGFSLFLSWLFLLLLAALRLQRSPKPLPKTIGWLGIFVLAGLVMEGFSLDTFALPYYWISLGWVTATSGNFGSDCKPVLEPDSPNQPVVNEARPAAPAQE